MYGFSSVLTVTSLTAPSRSATAASRIGVSWRHGPHHGAQKSTTTGVSRDASTTCSLKSASETATVTLELSTFVMVDPVGPAPSHQRPHREPDTLRAWGP